MVKDPRKLAQQQFGKHAINYVTSTDHSQGSSLSRLLALTQPASGWLVLDVATGGGHTALRFAPHSALVIASDLTHPMLLAARNHIFEREMSNVTFCQHDAQQLPYANNTFDLVTCRIAPHHFPDVAQFVREAGRVVKVDGLVAVADNMVTGEPEIAQFVNTFEALRDPSHIWAYSMEDWDTFFFSAGLTTEHRETFQKVIEFDSWAARMGVTGRDLTRMRALLVRAPSAPREWLRVQVSGQRAEFTLTEGIIIGRKQN